jgi:hypothetical protein
MCGGPLSPPRGLLPISRFPQPYAGASAVLRDELDAGCLERAADGGEGARVERFATLQRQIISDGAIWVVTPKKAVAQRRGLTLTWEEMQAAALTTDLVDNKNASMTDEEYGTRFVIRKERRIT